MAVATFPRLEKRRYDPATNTQGNNLTRNFLLEFSGARELTQITVEAAVWQLDFTVRLKGIDERERLSNRDIYGRAAFLDDGWLLTNTGGAYRFEAGRGYVEGIRAALQEPTPLVPAVTPCEVWLDVSMLGQGSDVVTVVTPLCLEPGAECPDYTVGYPVNTEHHCEKELVGAMSEQEMRDALDAALAEAMADMDMTAAMRDMRAGEIVMWGKATIPTLSDGLPAGLELNGSVVSLATFPRLLRAWVGETDNATAGRGVLPLHGCRGARCGGNPHPPAGHARRRAARMGQRPGAGRRARAPEPPGRRFRQPRAHPKPKQQQRFAGQQGLPGHGLEQQRLQFWLQRHGCRRRQ